MTLAGVWPPSVFDCAPAVLDAPADLGRSTLFFEALRPASPPAAAPAPQPRVARRGMRVGGYRLLKRIGQGAHGEIWKAVSTREPGARPVALKVLPPALARDARRLDQLQREAALGQRLQADGLLTAFELGDDHGLRFLAMPLVEGYSLRQVIRQRRRRLAGRIEVAGHWRANLDEAEYVPSVTRVVARVARALHSVHAAGAVHRDVKPANILLHRYRGDRVFLCDFGIARDLHESADNAPRDGSGTPRYMAPEALLGRPADAVRCDVYALGVTLCEAVTLVHPIAVPDTLPRAVLAVHLATVEPTRPTALCPGLPEGLEAIILRAMDRQPNARYASAAAFADDLERFLVEP